MGSSEPVGSAQGRGADCAMGRLVKLRALLCEGLDEGGVDALGDRLHAADPAPRNMRQVGRQLTMANLAMRGRARTAQPHVARNPTC